MIDVTATMLPSTVINDRSLDDQIASSAIIADSKILFIFFFGLLSTFTRSPSAMPRTELYGPVITWSPALRPDSTSKYLSPAMPILIGTNSALPSRTTKTPSVSLRVWPGLSSAVDVATGAASAAARRFLSVFGSFTTWPFAS